MDDRKWMPARYLKLPDGTRVVAWLNEDDTLHEAGVLRPGEPLTLVRSYAEGYAAGQAETTAGLLATIADCRLLILNMLKKHVPEPEVRAFLDRHNMHGNPLRALLLAPLPVKE